MNSPRRYNEEEIAAIFKQAAADQDAAKQQLPHSGGLTLADLEQIGKEAGITPEYIARAAAVVDRTAPTPPPTTYLGFPITVEHTVDLPGPLTDDDWERLVVDLRDTFRAAGKVQRDGALRQWSNGNLHALLEPTESGHRLRLRTLNSTWRSALAGGLIFFLIHFVFLLIIGPFEISRETMVLALFSAMGLAGIGAAAYRLPRWREERRRQMETIATRAVALAGDKQEEAEVESAAAPRLDLDSLETQDASGSRRRDRARE